MRFIPFFLVFLLGGCASTVTLGPAQNGGHAIILGQIDRSRGALSWRSYSLLTVDNEPVKHAPLSDRYDTVVHLSPGNHRLVVQAAFNGGYGSGGPWDAIVLLKASVEAGRTYRLNGDVRDNLYVVWLEDSLSNAKVSDEAASTFTSSRSGGTVVPIFIPSRR